MLKYQRTLRNEIRLEGIGLHTGYKVKLTLVPAAANTGIVFARRSVCSATARHRAASISCATRLFNRRGEHPGTADIDEIVAVRGERRLHRSFDLNDAAGEIWTAIVIDVHDKRLLVAPHLGSAD